MNKLISDEEIEIIERTADDEEPKCGRCDHMNDSDKWCMDNCGGANLWSGYRRTEVVETEVEK